MTQKKPPLDYVPLHQLRPSPFNPRAPSEVGRLAADLLKRPRLLTGHRRFRIAEAEFTPTDKRE